MCEDFELDIYTKYDIVFKKLFGSTKRKKITIHFLNSILNLPYEIKNITLIDDEEESKLKKMNNLVKKFLIMDCENIENENENIDNDYYEGILRFNSIVLTAETENNDCIDIVLQLINRDKIYFKSLFYNNEKVLQYFSNPKTHDEIPNTIMINLLDYKLFKKDMKHHWLFHYKEKRNIEEGKIIEDLINVYIIELPKFEKENIEIMRIQHPWLLFLQNPNEQCFKGKKTPKQFKKARMFLLMLSHNNEFIYGYYRSREKRYRDYISAYESSFRKGYIRGCNIAKIKYVISLLLKNKDKIFICKSLNNSLEKVNLIEKFMYDPNNIKKDIKLYFKLEDEDIEIICKDCNLPINEKK